MYCGESSLKRKHEEESLTPKKKSWSANEEITLLRDIVAYEKETGTSYGSNWNKFYKHIQSSSKPFFTKEQVKNKVGKLKKKYKNNLSSSTGNGNEQQVQIFNLSQIIWASDDDPTEAVPISVVKEEETKEDELCDLKKTLDSTVSFPSLTRDQEESMLHKLRKPEEAFQRKNLAEEWEVLLVQELQLKIKKQAFFKKISNA